MQVCDSCKRAGVPFYRYTAGYKAVTHPGGFVDDVDVTTEVCETCRNAIHSEVKSLVKRYRRAHDIVQYPEDRFIKDDDEDRSEEGD